MTPDSEKPPAADDSRLDLALRASNEGIWDWRTDRPEIYYSRRILEFLECSDTHPPNLFLEPYERIHDEDRPRFAIRLASALDAAGPELLAMDCRVRTNGGDWRWLRIRGAIVRDRTGHAIRIAGSMIDISRRKAAESRMEEERHLLSMLIDHVPLQVFFKDKKSRFVLANRKMAERMGVDSPRDLLGHHDRDYFGPEHWKEAEADESLVMQGLEPMTEKLERETWPDKDDNWVVTSKFPWFDNKGKLKGTFGISNDVTDLVQAQQRAAELAAELSERNRAYEEEVQLAREIQQAFAAPTIPEVGNESHQLKFGSRYLPISGLAGDFFEILPISKDCAGLLVCDVMGHGVRSALVVSMLRGLMEKQRRSARDPTAFLGGLNRGLAAIFERARITMFATAIYAVIDISQQTVRCACAGHPSAIILGTGGPRTMAKPRNERGPGLGLVGGAEFPTVESLFREGERLLLFTDGLLEAEDAGGEPFMEARLLETLAGLTELPLESMLDRVVRTVLTHAQDHRFDDDVCLLASELQTAPVPAS